MSQFDSPMVSYTLTSTMLRSWICIPFLGKAYIQGQSAVRHFTLYDKGKCENMTILFHPFPHSEVRKADIDTDIERLVPLSHFSESFRA